MNDMSSDLAHELRTPITAILGYTNLLVEDFVGPPEHLEKLLVIRNHSEYLLKLANHLLSRDAKGSLARIGPMDPVAVAEDVVELMRPVARSKRLSLGVQTVGALPPSISCDEMRLRQVLINLLGNALKFTNDGSVRVELRFVPEPVPVLRVAVADSGIGMDAEQIGRLFQPFVQVHASSKRRGGAGLGLSTSLRLVRQLGGELAVESAAGRGTTFTLTLPAPGIELRHLAVPAPRARQVGEGPLTGFDVLLADGRPDTRLIISVLLKKAGASVTLGADTESACAKAVAAKSGKRMFHVLLIDVHAPGIDGLAATRSLREGGYDGLIVGMDPDGSARERCLDAGMDDVLVKPLDPERLIATVADAGRNVGGNP